MDVQTLICSVCKTVHALPLCPPVTREEKTASLDNKSDALTQAHRASRQNGLGYAFAVQWPDHWTVETRKPLFRPSIHGRPAEVIECRAGQEFCA